MVEALHNLIEENIALIDKVINNATITLISGNKYLVTTNCNSKYVILNKYVTINGNQYKVTDVTDNTFTVESAIDITIYTSVTLFDANYFKHGTVKQTIGEIRQENPTGEVIDIDPLIYLKEVISEKVNTKYSESPIARETKVKIFFMTNSSRIDWKTDDHYIYAINPMNRLSNLFVEALNKNTKFQKVKEFDVTFYANFGTYEDKGFMKQIFDNNYSGVELEITLQINKTNCC